MGWDGVCQALGECFMGLCTIHHSLERHLHLQSGERHPRNTKDHDWRCPGWQAQGSRIWLARGYQYLLGLGLHLMDLKEPLMFVMRQITAGILSPRDSRAWGESNFLLLILSCGAKGPSREWYLLCLSYLLICVFWQVNTQYAILGSESKFFPTNVSSQSGAHHQRLLPKTGYPDDELELNSLAFRKCQLPLKERQGLTIFHTATGFSLQIISEQHLPVLSEELK